MLIIFLLFSEACESLCLLSGGGLSCMGDLHAPGTVSRIIFLSFTRLSDDGEKRSTIQKCYFNGVKLKNDFFALPQR